jgi:aminocarboxymuconate-semialdehyde decarboxylase
MHIIDSHFHWWPSSVLEQLRKRKDFPRAEPNARGGYSYLRGAGRGPSINSWADWYDLDKQLEHMDGLGHQVDVVCSIGPLSVAFSDLAPEEGRDLATLWNEEMAGAQRKHPGRLWASAAVPLVDTRIAI